MEPIILAIMLFLSYIVSPGQYHPVEIENIYQSNEQTIHAVQADPELMQIVETDHLPEVEFILVDYSQFDEGL